MLVDINSGEVSANFPNSPSYQADLLFYSELQGRLREDEEAELSIRAEFQEYTQSFVDMLALQAEFSSKAASKKLRKQTKRLKALSSSDAYSSYLELETTQAKLSLDDPIGHMYRLLTRLKLKLELQELTEREAFKIYLELDTLIHDPSDVTLLLSMLPRGNLHMIAWGLSSQDQELMMQALSILMKVEEALVRPRQIGAAFINKMEYVELLSYQQLKATVVA